MPAYVISILDVRDAAAFGDYRTVAQATIADHGGRYLARGGHATVLEGDVTGSVSILRFDGPERALAWYRSTAYAKTLELRARAFRRSLLVVQSFLEHQPPG